VVPSSDGLFRRHEGDRGSPVIEPGGIAGGHQTVFFEDRPQLGDVLDLGIVADMFVRIKNRLLAATADGQRDDLVFEVTIPDRFAGTAMAFQRERVLTLAGDAVFCSATFSAVTPICPMPNGSCRAPVIMSCAVVSPIFWAPAGGRHQIPGPAHAFSAAREG
jgi:hypothetical protein